MLAAAVLKQTASYFLKKKHILLIPCHRKTGVLGWPGTIAAVTELHCDTFEFWLETGKSTLACQTIQRKGASKRTFYP